MQRPTPQQMTTACRILLELNTLNAEEKRRAGDVVVSMLDLIQRGVSAHTTTDVGQLKIKNLGV